MCSKSEKKHLRDSKYDEGQILNELQEKMNRLKFRLLDYENQNQLLRKELLVAAKVMEQENIGYDHRKEFKGQVEEANVLREKIADLQNRIREVKNHSCHCELPPIPRTTKQQKDLVKDVFEKSCKVKRKIECWKIRNKELKEDSDRLRLELAKLAQKEQEMQENFHDYPKIEKDLRSHQREKLDLSSQLVCAETRNEQLAHEVRALKEDVGEISAKIKDDEMIVEALTSQNNTFQEFIKREKLIGKDNQSRYKNDLNEIKNKYYTIFDVLGEVRDLLREGDELQQKFQDSVSFLIYLQDENDKSKNSSTKEEQSTSLRSHDSQESSLEQESDPLENSDLFEKHKMGHKASKNVLESSHEEVERMAEITVSNNVKSYDSQESSLEQESEPLEKNDEFERLERELNVSKNVLESSHEEVERMSEITVSNNDKLLDWISQLLHVKSEQYQKNLEIRNLEEKLLLLESLSTTSKMQSSSKKNQYEEMVKKEEVLKEENKYLVLVWRTLSAMNLFQTYSVSTDKMWKIFIDALRQLKKTNYSSQAK